MTSADFFIPSEIKDLQEDDRPTWLFDFSNHKMLWANDTALTFWGSGSLEEFVNRDFSSDSTAVRERLQQALEAVAPGHWVRESWTLFPQEVPTTVVVDARLVQHAGEQTVILFRLIRHLDVGDVDPEGLRMMLAARATPVSVSLFDLQGRLFSENPAGLQLRKSVPSWTDAGKDLSLRYGSVECAGHICMAVRNDERFSFEYAVPDSQPEKVLAVTARRVRDPVTGDFVVQITEEDISEKARLAEDLAELNESLQNRDSDRAQELARLNAQLRSEIEARKRAQAEVEAERDFMRTLLDSLPVPVFYKDREGLYLGCNEHWAQLLGMPKEDIVGKTVSDVLQTDKDPAPLTTDQTVLDSGQPGEFPMQITGQDGQLRHVISYKAPFATKLGTKGIIGTVIDLTEQKKVEAELKQREVMLREATYATRTGFLVYDNETREVEFATETFRELLGISKDDFLKLMQSIDNRYDVMSNAQGKEIQKTVSEAERNAAPFDVNYEIARGPTKGRTLRVKGYPLPIDGERHKKRVSFMQDITDSIAKDKQLRQSQKFEAIGRLTGGVAHDFNNLLAVVLGNAELLTAQKSFSADLVSEIEAACHRGADLTRSLLAYARKQPLNATSVDLSARSHAMEKLLQRALGEQINLSLTYQPDLWRVHLDAGQFEDALLNLALNARDAMPSGGELALELKNVTLDGRVVSGSDDSLLSGEFVACSVKDQGVGMSPDVQGRSIDPFFTTKATGQGSGLGLSMVYGFVRQSDGGLEIESEVGHGTKVTLYLPKQSSVEPAPIENRALAEVPKGNGEHILLVEDDEAVSRMISRILGSLNYQHVRFNNAKAALEYLQHNDGVDLLLSDIVLPDGMFGSELAQLVRQQRADLPIILMSGYPADEREENKGIPDGVPLLSKPVKRLDLGIAIGEAIHKR